MPRTMRVTIHDGVSDLDAAWMLLQVIKQGRISESRGIHHYCWHSTSPNGLAASVRQKRSAESADSFVIYREATNAD